MARHSAAEIYYSINDYVKKSAANTPMNCMRRYALLFGGAEVSFDDTFAPNNHIMGTTIMGSDPGIRLSTADCRTHDHSIVHRNSGVMPTAAS